MRTSDPAAAAREFEAADGLCPDPWYQGLLAVCYEKTGRITNAIEAINTYLKHSNVGQRDQATAARERLVAMLAKVEVVTDPPGAALRLAGAVSEANEVSPAELTLDPGHYRLDVQLDGHEPQRRELEVAVGEELRVDVTLRAAGSRAPDEPAPQGERSVRRRLTWTGAAGLAVDVAIPLNTDTLKTSAGIAAELCGGLELRRVRIELALRLDAFPDTSGYIIELSGGPRLGVRLGSLPLWLELEVLLGWSLINVSSDQALIPLGSYSGLAVTPGIVLTYRVIDWLELFLRPARFEILNIGGDVLGGAIFRWGLDLGVRFRR